MSLTFELRETIAAPIEKVFGAMVDVDRMGEWMPGFVRAERLTPGPLGKGSKLRETRKMFGHEATEVFEVTEYAPPRVFGLYVDGTKGSSKRGWFRFKYSLARVGASTEVTLSGECGGVGGCMALLGRLMIGVMKKAIRKDMLAQKAWIERGGGAPRA